RRVTARVPAPLLEGEACTRARARRMASWGSCERPRYSRGEPLMKPLGDLGRSEQCLGLVHRLPPLLRGLGVGDNSAARLDVEPTACDVGGPQRDAGVKVAGEVEVADHPGVGPAAGR